MALDADEGRPLDVDASTAQSQGRSRRLAFALVSGLLGRGIAVLAPLVMVPILLSVLGESRFGVWATVTSFASMLVFADLGLGSGLLTRLSDAFGVGDFTRGRRLTSDGYVGLTAIAVVGLCVVLLLVQLGDVAGWLGVPPTQARDAEAIVIVILSAFFVSMPLSLIGRVQLGVQQAWQTNVWAALGPAISIPIVWGLASSGAGPIMVVAGASAGPILIFLANTAVFFSTRLGRRLRPNPRWASWEGSRALIGLGSVFAALSILSNVALNVDNVLVAATLGSREVAPYAVALRLFASTALLINIVGLPLWGANGAALAQGDLRWIRRTTRLAALGLTGASMALVTMLIVFREPIVAWWVGPGLATPFWLYAGLGVWSVLSSMVSPFFMVQNAAGFVRVQVVGWGFYLVLSVAGKALVLHSIADIEWVPWIGAVCYAATVVPSALIGYHLVMASAKVRHTLPSDESDPIV